MKGEYQMRETIIGIFKEYVGEKIEIDEKSELYSDLGLTSFDAVTLIGIMSEKCNIKIELSDVSNFKTVGDIIEWIK